MASVRPDQAASPARRFDVFYDYLCPFVYRASVLLQNVRDSGERPIDVRWRYFSLIQVNSKDEGWTVWDAVDSEARGRLAFKAAEAARRQGGFDNFHMALLRARHEQRADIDDVAVGHDYLAQFGTYEHMWGIGRHVLGSQVYDYWADPWGRVHEHWADSDRLNLANGSNLVPAEEALTSQWGEAPPKKFIDHASP